MLSGILIGAVLMASSNAFADQIKSLVGKTVAGEYTVNVDGKTLSEKAIVVDSKAHVPLRAVSDSLGAKINVEGRIIEVTTTDLTVEKIEIPSIDPVTQTQQSKQTKSELLNSKENYVNQIIPNLQAAIQKRNTELESSKKSLLDYEATKDYLPEESYLKGLKQRQDYIDSLTKELTQYSADLSKRNMELSQIEEALKALSNQ